MSDVRRLSAHREFLNRYYGWSRRIYDVTRKYYLFGRDTALERLLEERWDRLIEIGPGTGRNLRKLHARRPMAKFGGIEASDAMLVHARSKCPWASFQHGFAETADYQMLLGDRPDRVLFSYCLSMVTDAHAALDNALSTVAPQGEVWVVDFSDLAGLPSTLAKPLRKWLATFHVEPLPPGLFDTYQPALEHGRFRYFVIARLRPKLES